MPDRFPLARDLLRRAIATRAFPAATVEVGTKDAVLWREPFGRLTYEADAAPARDDTIFDLASLTKVLATTALVMREVERGGLRLDDAVRAHLATWQGHDRAHVTVRDLLSHSAGLPAHRPFFRQYAGRGGFETAICTMPLEYTPGSASLYSDFGFMLLGFMLDHSPSLAGRFDTMLAQMGNREDLEFQPPMQWVARTAPTEADLWRGRLLMGEVHDANAWALGGVAGHAGLFGTAAAVGTYARDLLRVLDGQPGFVQRATLETFIARRSDVPESSRGLGWDTMLSTSSCGTRMSARAFGHTGFTGTSLWIDPERGVYAVLLTNRVHPTPANNAIAQVRPAFHDAVMAELG